MSLYGLGDLLEGQIRLLRVQPQEEPTSIKCSVSIHNIEEASTLSFAALSYTWGSCYRAACAEPGRADKFSIRCNSDEVEIRENLHAFLCHYAASDEPLLRRCEYLWIDALCIDQRSDAERSSQVRLMGRIYMVAAQVNVWLGPQDESTGQAMALIRALDSLSDRERAELNWYNVSAGDSEPLRNHGSWTALARFFSRSWFTRAWIVQEAVFAQDCIVLCGEFVLSWEALVAMSHFLSTTRWGAFLREINEQQSIEGNWHTTPARLEASRRTWKGSYHEGLLYALIRARTASCQDARDKVYSQLGLGRSGLYPDYRLSVGDAYISAARHILEQSKSMLLLTCVEGEEFQNAAHGLPSWVPDWSVTDGIGLRVTGYRSFKASGGRQPQYSVSVQGARHVLSVEATKIDVIAATCEAKPVLREHLHTSSFWPLIAGLTETLARIYPGQTLSDVVWRTLITNRESTPPKQSITYPASAARLAASFRSWILWRYVEGGQGEVTAYPGGIEGSQGESDVAGREENERQGESDVAGREENESQGESDVPGREENERQGQSNLPGQAEIKRQGESDVPGREKNERIEEQPNLPGQAANKRTQKQTDLPGQAEIKRVLLRASKDSEYKTELGQSASIFEVHFSHALLQRPFRTEKGYFGTGTQCLRAGDSVWVVSGCRVPVILRAVEGRARYRLVGGSYAHGLMDGEGVAGDVGCEVVSLE